MLRDLIALPMNSKLWVYQGDREFSYDEMEDIREAMYDFVDNWESHGIPVQGYGNIFHRRFLVFVADETGHGVSGCSTDKSVNLVKQLGARFNADFFNRWMFAFMDENEEIFTMDKDAFAQAYQAGKLKEDSLVFDPLVNTKAKFLTDWVIPIKDSWHKQFA